MDRICCESLNITFSLKKIDHNNLIQEVCSEKLGFCICAFVFVSEKFLHCGIENIMNTEERFAEMALAIQKLAQAVTRLVQNEGKLTNLKPLSPYKTISTPTKQKKISYDLNKSNRHEGVFRMGVSLCICSLRKLMRIKSNSNPKT